MYYPAKSVNIPLNRFERMLQLSRYGNAVFAFNEQFNGFLPMRYPRANIQLRPPRWDHYAMALLMFADIPADGFDVAIQYYRQVFLRQQRPLIHRLAAHPHNLLRTFRTPPVGLAGFGIFFYLVDGEMDMLELTLIEQFAGWLRRQNRLPNHLARLQSRIFAVFAKTENLLGFLCYDACFKWRTARTINNNSLKRMRRTPQKRTTG
jgi:hypothetical protein